MFLAVVHKSKRVDTSRTVENSWMLDVRPLRCWKLDRCAVGSWTAALLEAGPLRCWKLDRCAAGCWKLEGVWLPDRWRGEIKCSLLLSDYFLAPYYVQHIPARQPAFPNAATLRAPCAEASLLWGIRCSKETLKNKQELHFLLVESRKQLVESRKSKVESN